jgi:hypothetical protein
MRRAKPNNISKTPSLCFCNVTILFCSHELPSFISVVVAIEPSIAEFSPLLVVGFRGFCQIGSPPVGSVVVSSFYPEGISRSTASFGFLPSILPCSVVLLRNSQLSVPTSYGVNLTDLPIITSSFMPISRHGYHLPYLCLFGFL